MKNNIKNKIKEIGGYIVCLVIILVIGYYSGILNGFGITDFENAYNQITSSWSQNPAIKNKAINIGQTTSKGSTRATSYNNYQVAKIPVSVVRAISATNSWTEIFNTNYKVIFYLYDSKMDSFDASIKNYVQNRNLANKYKVQAYSKTDLSRLNLGAPGPSKICDSLQECNAVRQKAADYASMSEFLKNCGRTMCIINQSKGEYIRLRNRDNSIKIIEDMQNW